MATMQSTRTGHVRCSYLGADPTDRFAARPRDIDVCELEVTEGGMVPYFWTWRWERGGTLDIEALLPEVRDARRVMIDAPQALAASGRGLRECERALGTPGKT